MVLKKKLTEEQQKRKEEEREFGVFYDDDYAYMKHLKDRSQVEHDWSEADRSGFLLVHPTLQPVVGLDLETTMV